MGHGQMRCRASYSYVTLECSNFLHVSLPQLFPPECWLECPSGYDRHGYVLPCLVVLLSSLLLTLTPTPESTALKICSCFWLRRGASDTLFSAVSVCAHPSNASRSCVLREGRGGEEGGDIAICKPFGAGYAASNC